MVLKLKPPLMPMEATLVNEIPHGDGWQYEPKWDGFRCLVFRDRDTVRLQSKSGQPLERYFPEVVDTVRSLAPSQFVLDSELVIEKNGSLSFNDLLLRMHPAESRIRKLSVQSPAKLIVFDLLLESNGTSLIHENLVERRRKLEKFAEEHFSPESCILLSPASRSPEDAENWFSTTGPSLDGIMAKRLDMPYLPDSREGMIKVKKLRTVDCVVGGFRYSIIKKTNTQAIGSLLLGLYDEHGLLHHIGYTSSLKATERIALKKKLEREIEPPGFTGKAPGGPSRWSTKRSTEWQPLNPKFVVEVAYDHFTSGRFRHGTRFIRWRPDKKPRQCTMDQIRTGAGALQLLFQSQPMMGH